MSPVSRLIFVAALAPALAACSNSSGSSSGATPDASASGDARGDATGAGDTGFVPDTGGVDTSSGDDSGAADAGADVAIVLCGADAGCVTGTLCCVNSGPGFCGQDCACWTGLGCANAGQCAVTTDVCCIQPTTVGCTAGTQQSVCLASCNGLTQLCSPSTANECLTGRCATDPASLKRLNLPLDAGYGLCQ